MVFSAYGIKRLFDTARFMPAHTRRTLFSARLAEIAAMTQMRDQRPQPIGDQVSQGPLADLQGIGLVNGPL